LTFASQTAGAAAAVGWLSVSALVLSLLGGAIAIFGWYSVSRDKRAHAATLLELLNRFVTTNKSRRKRATHGAASDEAQDHNIV
jgi:hypothetical protein